MGRARVERHVEGFRRTGMVTLRASALKCVFAVLGSLVLAMFPAVMSAGAFQENGAGSLKGWGLALVALFFVMTTFLAVAPLVRGRQLTLTRLGLAVSSRRQGERVREMGLRWEEITGIEHYSSGSTSTASTEVRMHLVPGAGRDARRDSTRDYVDMPFGFAVSNKDLAELLEGIRSSRAAQR